MIRRSTRGAATTATTPSRCSRGSAPQARCTRSRCPTASAPGSSPATPRPGPRSTTRGCPRTCTPRSPATAPWSPRACPAPRSPGTCSASTRPTTPGCAPWPPPRSAARGSPRCDPRIQAIVDDLLDELHRRGDTVVDLVAGFAFPLPFTVISELLGDPEPDRAELGAWFTTLLAPASAPEPPAERGRGLGEHRALPDRAARPQTRRAGRGPGHRPRPGRRRTRRAEPAGDAVHDLPAHRRRARHHHQPDRQRRRSRCCAIPTSAPRWSPTPASCRGRSRRCCAGTPPCRTRRSATPPRTSRSATS